MTEPAGLIVSEDTQRLLREYISLLRQWNKSINLVSPSSLPDVWARHVQDSLQLLVHLDRDWSSWTDLGSGGGFPGVVVAIVARGIGAHRRVNMIESDRRKAMFLRKVVAQLDLPGNVIVARIEEVTPQGSDIVSARALSPLPDLLPLVERHLAPSGLAVLPKGRSLDAELQAVVGWSFESRLHRSVTDPAGTILHITELKRL